MVRMISRFQRQSVCRRWLLSRFQEHVETRRTACATAASDCVSMTSIVSPYISRFYYLSLFLSLSPSFLPIQFVVSMIPRRSERRKLLYARKVHSLKWIMNSPMLLAVMRKLFLADTLNVHLDNYFLLTVIYCAIVFISIYLPYSTLIDWKTFNRGSCSFSPARIESFEQTYLRLYFKSCNIYRYNTERDYSRVFN